MVRTTSRALITAVAALAVALQPGTSGEAAPLPDGNLDCPHGGNFVSQACFHGSHIDVFANWHNNGLTATTGDILDSGHINHALWTFSGAPCGDRFVEVGLTKGFEGANVYTWYYARDRGDGNGGYSHTQYTGRTASPDGSNHEYHLKYAATDATGGVYEIYLDSVKINAFPENHQGFGSCLSATGLEVQKHFLETSPRTGYSSDYFDAYNLRSLTRAARSTHGIT